MSTLHSKRRKLNPNALMKPFKSPLPRKDNSASSSATSPPAVQGPSHKLSASSPSRPNKSTNESTQTNLPQPSSSSPKPFSLTGSLAVSSSPSKCLSTPSSIPPSISKALKALQSEHTALLTELASLRQQLDKTNESLRLENSNRDIELERLIRLWTEASRAAAEELFAIAKDRVNSMGGLRVWKEREEERRERWRGEWDSGVKEGGEDGDGERVMDREGEDEEKQEDSEGNENAPEKGEGIGVAKAAENETFTMDMMLRSLGVDLSVIGFDAELQRWKD